MKSVWDRWRAIINIHVHWAHRPVQHHRVTQLHMVHGMDLTMKMIQSMKSRNSRNLDYAIDNKNEANNMIIIYWKCLHQLCVPKCSNLHRLLSGNCCYAKIPIQNGIVIFENSLKNRTKQNKYKNETQRMMRKKPCYVIHDIDAQGTNYTYIHYTYKYIISTAIENKYSS